MAGEGKGAVRDDQAPPLPPRRCVCIRRILRVRTEVSRRGSCSVCGRHLPAQFELPEPLELGRGARPGPSARHGGPAAAHFAHFAIRSALAADE